MKYNRFFRILTVAVILSLLMIAIPATPALAASVTIDPEKGEIGSRVNIEGAGFQDDQRVYIYFSSQEADTGDQIDDEVTAYEEVKRVDTYGPTESNPGTFATTFYVPDKLTDGDDDEVVHGGTYYIYTTLAGSDDIITVDEFTVIGIEQLTPAEGPVGTRAEIEGVAFEDRESISIKYDGDDVNIAGGDKETESDGDFTSYILVPESTAGVHTITARVEDDEGEFQFTVVPSITLSSTSGASSDEVTVTGTGFGGGANIAITFDGSVIGEDDTNDYGSFESTFIVPPEVKSGPYEIKVEDEDGNSAEVEFDITAHLILSSGATADSPGYVGMTLTVNGTNFKAIWPIAITYTITATDTKEFSAESEDGGSFSYSFTVPPSKAGVHIITATDGTNTTQARFFVESTPPEIPPLLLPLSGEKLEGEFDWEDVADDSQPVTYDLQVATDADFTTLLVDKTEITASAYTLTEDEKLGKTSEEEPYYWRVRAVDAASNVGDWASASAFYIGSIFTGWLLYTLIGIGVLGVIILIIWVVRRLPREDYYY